MPKNSRPDIQVLEARVSRLRAQLLEYKEIRTYDITKHRLRRVANELEECMMIIAEITDKDDSNSRRLIALREPEGPRDNEFEDDGDLADVLFNGPEESDNNSEVSKKSRGYRPKFIVGQFAINLQKCADTPTGIIQINQMSQILNSWYQARFTPETRNPNFYYKASRIHEWIDLLILAGGKALYEGTFSEFKLYMDKWIEDLNTSKDENWLLPLQVRQITQSSGAYTKEAIFIEKIIKSILYTDTFYGDLKDSVARIVIKEEGYDKNEVTIEALLKSCKHVIPTSSFDVTRYQ